MRYFDKLSIGLAEAGYRLVWGWFDERKKTVLNEA